MRLHRRVILPLLLFVFFAVPAKFSGLAAEPEHKPASSAIVAPAIQDPQTLPILMGHQPSFPNGILLGGDVKCDKDGILRFEEKQLQLCVSGVWHIVTLQP